MNVTCVKPSHRRQQIWVCVIAVLFLCDFVLCGYLPSQQRLTSLQQVQAQQRRTIDMAAAQGAELPGLKTRLRDTERVIERFETCVPSDSALGTFLQQIAALMTEYKLTDPVVLPGKEQEGDDLGWIPIHMTCQGTMTDLFGFFNRLQTLDRLVRVEKAMLENDPDFTGRLTMRTEGFIFYQVNSVKTQDAAKTKPAEGAGDGA